MRVENINNIYREKIHAPRAKDGTVYYVPINGDKLSEVDRKFINNAELMKVKSNYCNSATNIRRVWLSLNHVAIEYYASPMFNGKRGELVYVKKLDKNLFELAKDYFNYKSLSLSQKNIAKAIGEKLPEQIKIEGRGLQSLTSPWTCNNIEEVYFDWGLLISQDAEIILNQMNSNVLDIIKKFSGCGEKYAMVNTDIPMKLMFGLDSENISKTYKRLKTIAMVSKLDKYIENEDSFRKSINTFIGEKAESSSKEWLLNIKDSLKTNNCEVWCYINKGALNNTNIDNFTIKNYQYEFDNLYLKQKIESYISKLSENLAEKIVEEVNNKEELSTEVIIKQIEEEYGVEVATAIFKVASMEVGIEAIKELLPKFKNSEYYTNMLGGNLK